MAHLIGVLTSGVSVLVRYFLFSVSHPLALESSITIFLATLAFLVILSFLVAPALTVVSIVAAVAIVLGLAVVLSLLRYCCS